MCGIVGIVSNKNVKDILISNLHKLEYRGYDSAGVAIINEKLNVVKSKGRVFKLENEINKLEGKIGIAHTRWATHGIPNTINSHPHTSLNGRFTIVHNGIIDNYLELKESLLPDINLLSETDTEVVVNIIEKFSKSMSTKEAIIKTVKFIKGSYAILVLDTNDKNKIYVMKNKSPLLIGNGDGFNIIASDPIAIINETNIFYEINDNEIAILQNDSFSIYDKNDKLIKRNDIKLDIDNEDSTKGKYPHYMIKEIEEQPFIIDKIIKNYYDINCISNNVLEVLKNTKKIIIVAAGTSYNAGLIAKTYFKKISKINCEVIIASEFNNDVSLYNETDIFIFISQSGETADIINILDKVNNNIKICITNTKGSTLDRLSDFSLLLHAGKEISVAATKSYTAQLIILYILANKLIDKSILNELIELKNSINEVINNKTMINNDCKLISNKNNLFYIGKGLDFASAIEASLKLKEVSYIHSEGIPSGELKHGSIALIEDGTPVVVIDTQKETSDKVRNNLNEVKSRGAYIFVISSNETKKTNDNFIIPNSNNYLYPILVAVITQYMAYFVAKEKGCDIDKPKNLAKSVTVE